MRIRKKRKLVDGIRVGNLLRWKDENMYEDYPSPFKILEINYNQIYSTYTCTVEYYNKEIGTCGIRLLKRDAITFLNKHKKKVYSL